MTLNEAQSCTNQGVWKCARGGLRGLIFTWLAWIFIDPFITDDPPTLSFNNILYPQVHMPLISPHCIQKAVRSELNLISASSKHLAILFRMAPPAPTILTLKQNFITTQTRLLSQPLQPSRAWRRANEAAAANNDEDAAAISERAIDDALFRLNHTLQQHSRRVYATQATRQIAEQVDKLYLSAGERHAAAVDDDGDDDDDGWRNVGADYADASVISSLPPAWESEREAAAYPLEAERYAELAGRLRGLAARRDEARARVERLRRMRALLDPFSGGGSSTSTHGAAAAAGAGDESSFGPLGGVQENLVRRDGEVEKELERMRMLLVRVGDKVARLKEKEAGRDDDDSDLFGDGDAMVVDDVEVEERRKVDGLLDGLG